MDIKTQLTIHGPVARSGRRAAFAGQRRLWSSMAASLFAVAIFSGAAGPQANPQKSANAPALPDANARMIMVDQQTKPQNFDAANTVRQKQIGADSAKLLKLATELKTEVDKTTKDTLSLNVIRKADEIEKLAHDVKEEMKLSNN